MYKAKLFAVTLAAVSLMSLSAPAFAETQENSGETRIESTTDNIDNEMDSGEDTDDETVPSENADDAADSSKSDNETDSEESTDNGSDESVSDSDQDNAENQLQADGNDIILPDTPSSTVITKNDKNQTVYTTDGMVAYVNQDGMSGCIYLDVNKLNKTILYEDYKEEEYVIDSVGDVSLDKIIKFNDGGYVRSIKGMLGVDHSDDYLNPIYTSDNQITVVGAGPEGLFSGSGHLKFTDQTDDTYSLAIWDHTERTHKVKYNSTAPYIKTIVWYSYDDDAEYPEYPYSTAPYSPSLPDVGYMNEEGQIVIEDEFMTVYINEDRISGHIDFDPNKLPVKTILKTDSRLGKLDTNCDEGTCEEWEIHSVCGIELRDIIKFNDGGYIGAICADYSKDDSALLAYGAGPSGLTSGFGYYSTTDVAGVIKKFGFINHASKWNYVHYGTDNNFSNMIKTFEWHS